MTMDHVEAVFFTHSLASMVRFSVSSILLQGSICFIRSWVYSFVMFSLFFLQVYMRLHWL